MIGTKLAWFLAVVNQSVCPHWPIQIFLSNSVIFLSFPCEHRFSKLLPVYLQNSSDLFCTTTVYILAKQIRWSPVLVQGILFTRGQSDVRSKEIDFHQIKMDVPDYVKVEYSPYILPGGWCNRGIRIKCMLLTKNTAGLPLSVLASNKNYMRTDLQTGSVSVHNPYVSCN